MATTWTPATTPAGLRVLVDLDNVGVDAFGEKFVPGRKWVETRQSFTKNATIAVQLDTLQLES